MHTAGSTWRSFNEISSTDGYSDNTRAINGNESSDDCTNTTPSIDGFEKQMRIAANWVEFSDDYTSTHLEHKPMQQKSTDEMTKRSLWRR